MQLMFVTVSMIGLTASECNSVHQCAVEVGHDCNTLGGRPRIAIAYPDYRFGVQTDATQARSYGEEQRLIRLRKGFLGRSIRLFGFSAELKEIIIRLTAGSLGDIAGLTISTPMAVPSKTLFGSYIAYKGLTKLTPSRVRRAIQRRAWERDPNRLTPDQLERKQVEQRSHPTYLPNVGVYSRSTEQTFSIFIKQQVADRLLFAPNTFGFSTPSQPCCIPIF